ncbi:MAG: sugar kinase [Candidatus Buchananbacteria bacterium]
MKEKLEATRSSGIDLLSLGALVNRLDPGVYPWQYAHSVEVHVSGGEFNVAANLAACFGQNTAIASAMVNYPLGRLIERQVQAMGVTPFYRRFEHNGVTGPNMATVYSDRGHGVRPPKVFYNRAEEAAAMLKPDDFDWTSIFSQGVRWFHSGGIFASLSKTTSQVIFKAMETAKAAGAVVSYDLNHRAKLWNMWTGPDSAAYINREIIKLADVLVGNEEDLQKGLGLKGPDVNKESDLDPAVFVAMIDQAREIFPNLKVLATTLRQVRSANRHGWSAVAWIGGKVYQAPTIELDVYDRVGGGDGFASGLFYGLMTQDDPQVAVNLGWAHGALLTTTPGDTTMVTLDDVKELAAGGSARISR